ncbi:hypothetical protein D4764_08G0003670 [Takifugu flavidus]|uniref:Uncharacterized protein n=1 Tax=Takifugu flavidus TaxID=433684 RepID=A0A5C6MSB5_9TELE|nr:hypothetical protein D4764_08G0003670 [Takifugu flavidus]
MASPGVSHILPTGQFFTIFGSSSRPPAPVRQGGPQGSVLGHILFTITHSTWVDGCSFSPSAEFCNLGIILDSTLPSQSQSKSATKFASSLPSSGSIRTPAIASCSGWTY